MGAPPFLLGTYSCWQTSPLVFLPEGGPADETEHERREPSRVEKGCEHPPGGISAAQVFIHHVSGDFHPILPPKSRSHRWSSKRLADVAVIFAGTGGRPSPRENSVRLDAGIFSGSCPKYEMALRHRASDGRLDLRANEPADQDEHGQRDPYGRGGIQAGIDQGTNNRCANDVMGEIERIGDQPERPQDRPALQAKRWLQRRLFLFAA